ncbi:MAG: 3'-5' exonuclease, partial [Dehalococcoidia bacterium]
VWARDLLRDDIGVRDYFRHKFTHLLIDEFQDTDPIQAEIALYLAEEVPPGTRESQRPRRWEDIQPQSGKLFVVGDPKQSIYRFRQADITLVNRLRDILGVDTLPLVQNFRSHRPVIEWANHVFGQWMVEGEGQPPYAPLHWKWEVAEDSRLGPAVHALGGPLPLKMPEVRRAEARAVARLMQRIRAEGWQVRDGEEPGGGARFRPALYRDVCLLVPRRTGLLRDLELTLEDAGVPYRLESASLVFDTQEVRDLLNCLEAVDNPVDGVALVAALRSPAFACSDVDLVSHLDGGGRLDYLRPGSNAPEGPVSDSLHALAEYHEQARWQSFPMLVERFVRGRKLLELALDHPRPREQWRRYQFVIDRARAFAEAGGTSLRAFLQWMREQQEEHARAVETPVPEGDEDAIRVLTIHGSKGLEFPIVVLADLGGAANAKSPAVLFRRQTNAESSEAAAGGAVHVHLGQFETLGYQGLRDWELEREQEEQVRLMYVASTRAKDHLVVSRFQVEEARHTSAASTIDAYMNGAEHLWSAVDLSASVGPVAPQSLSDAPGASATHADSPISREEWITQREHVLRLRSRPAAIAATTLAHEQREERGTDAEPWRRGRAGTSIGRAVHAVLQTIDLATGKGLEETARAQAQAEGLPERESEVAALAKHALSTDAVRRAVESGHWWREVPVGIPIGDGVLEGFIDLLFEEDGGLVVVDYKTDAARDDAAIDGAMERYRLQGAAYALAVERVTGLPVRESIFVFLQPRREIAIDGLREAMADAEQAAAAYLAG